MKTFKQPGIVSILFLGGAKRVAMARMFKAAAAKRKLQCRIVAYELSCHSAIASEGIVVEGLKWSDPMLYNDIARIIDEYKIDIMLPFVDPAVGVTAEYVTRYGNVFVPVSPKNLAEKMFDKIASADFFESLSIPIPPTWRHGSPLLGHMIAKPRFGSASKGIELIDSLRDLYRINGLGDGKYLIQQRFDNRMEYTVDCYADITDGHIAAISPRIRGEVSGGEVVRTTTIADGKIEELVKHTLTKTGLRGAVTVQILHDLDSDRLMIMEINPRLGGGAVASVHAGVDLPGLIIDNAAGSELAYLHPKAGVETVRYLDDVVFYPDEK